MTAPSGMTVGRLAHGIPAPNDGGGGLETFTAILRTGVQEFLHCVYGNNP
jgi:hypothetical protein